MKLRGSLGKVARAVGGSAALGELLGVSERSVQRWSRVGMPPRARILLERVAAEHDVPLSRRVARRRREERSNAKLVRVRLPTALGDLARATGGTARLAKLLGVVPATVRDWSSHGAPSMTRGLLARLAAEYGLSEAVQVELSQLYPKAPDSPRRAALRHKAEARPGASQSGA
jgi:DNA-binding transcriptional regulator YdaS (Cro superfamily)